MGRTTGAIETTFDIAVPERTTEQRLLFKNTPWTAIRVRIATGLRSIPVGGSVQQQRDRLMTVALEATRALTPKARPSPMAKRCGQQISRNYIGHTPIGGTR
jgi:hypothetical protein